MRYVEYQWHIEEFEEPVNDPALTDVEVRNRYMAEKLSELDDDLLAAALLPNHEAIHLSLVRDEHDGFGSGGQEDEAYVVGGQLPERFPNGGPKVPKRFHEEIARTIRRMKGGN